MFLTSLLAAEGLAQLGCGLGAGVATVGANNTELKGLPASLMKEASNIRYLSHIKALYGLAY